MRRYAGALAVSVLALSVCLTVAQPAAYYNFDGKWGSFGTGNGQFNGPYGLCQDASGRVYVADFSNNNVQLFTSTMAYVRQWGTSGSGDGEFDRLRDVAVSSEGKVYVADCYNYRVQIFSMAGSFIGKFGGHDTPILPTALELDDSDNVYICDSQNHRVYVCSSTGAFVRYWGSRGSGNTQFDWPEGIAYGAGGHVFVADTWNNRIVKYTSTGTYVTQWGTSGTGNGQFSGPVAVAVGPDNMVYVADTGNNRIQKFTATGTFRCAWGTNGVNEGQLWGPAGIHVGTDLKVWVTELYNHRVQRFRPNRRPTAPTSVVIKPSTVSDDTDMQVVASGATDPDGDTISYRYQWWKSSNGTTWTKGPNTKVVSDGLTTVGQYWKVEAWASDTIAKGPSVTSAPIQVSGNHAPTAPTKVAITPASPADSDKLTATASGATDADGDPLTYRYQWYVSTDGTTWTKGPAQRYVGAAATTTGELWKCQARAYDGITTGPAKTSATVEIGAGSASALTLTATAQGGEVSQIVVSLSAAANVRATITNMAGIVVAELPARDLEAGVSTLSWNGVGTSGSKVPGGVYLVRVTAATADGTQTGVLVPLRR